MACKPGKFSDSFERDWAFYTNCPFTFTGGKTDKIVVPEYSENGKSAKVAWCMYDSTGQMPSCREPETVVAVQEAKAATNFQIKQWVEGLVSRLFTAQEFYDDFPDAPEWVWTSLKKAALRADPIINPRFTGVTPRG
jgi:hypothetical protein